MENSFKSIFTSAKRGAFIVFEGCDRSGKTTQCKKLVEYFQKENIPVKQIHFPDRTTLIGKLINEYLTGTKVLNDRVLHLLFTANRWEFYDSIIKALQDGTTIIADRYSFSGVAYSTAIKNLDLNWCKAPEQGLPKPDLVLYLNARQLEHRPGYGEEIYEKESLQKAVANTYKRMFDPSWKMVNGDGQIEEVHAEIVNIVTNVLPGRIGNKRIKTMW